MSQSSPVVPMADDPSVTASLRADLAVAQAVGVEGLDVNAGAASLRSAIAAEGGAAAASGSKVLLLALAGAVTAGALAVALSGRAGGKPRLAKAVAIPSAVPLPPPPEPEPPARPSDGLPAAAPRPSPAPEVASARPPSAARPARAPAKAAPTQGDYVGEAELIARARRAMASSPQRALRLLRETESSFPDGLLQEEREALTVLTLHQLGREEQARERGLRFVSRHPQSAHVEPIRELLR